MATKKVAVACQGGGTHAAFTWGVLTEILRTKQQWDANPATAEGDTFDLLGISGTSAGALCALATWYGMAPNTADSDCGSIDKAIERLDFLWTTFAAITPIETLHNRSTQALLHLEEKGLPFPASNPYDVGGSIALASLSILGARPPYLSFPALLDALCPHFQSIDWPKIPDIRFRILVGAIEVLSGNLEVFDSEKSLVEKGLPSICKHIDQYSATRWSMCRALSLQGVAASGTLPEILRAQKIENTIFPTSQPGVTVRRDAYYWDGLYSQNPPVRDFFRVADRENKPDEIWVIRINPQEYEADIDNMALADIRDRENDLAGNLSLHQELDHIVSLNEWISAYGTDRPPLSNCKPVTVRTIKMNSPTTRNLRHTTKFDRSVAHLSALHEEGQAVARQWLADWRTLGSAFPCYPNDARYPETD